MLTIIFEELFHISLLTYLVLLAAEAVRKGTVRNFFDLNILLGIVILSGILSVIRIPALPATGGGGHRRFTDLLLNCFEQWEDAPEHSWNWNFAFAVSTAAGLLVYYRIQALGPTAVLISILAAVSIFLTSYFIYRNTD